MCNGLFLRGAKLSLLFNLAKKIAEYFFIKDLERPGKQIVTNNVIVLLV